MIDSRVRMADGLGRYGDPVDPYGDFRAMRTAWRALRPGGRLLLTVPIGPDLVVWNLHRRYGELRLPRLLRGWEQMEVHGWDEDAEALRTPADHRRRREVLWVLRRNGSGELAVREDGLDSEGSTALPGTHTDGIHIDSGSGHEEGDERVRGTAADSSMSCAT